MAINYHPEIVWFVNKALLALTLLLSVIILAYTALKEFFARGRARSLAAIENNLRNVAKAGPAVFKDACPDIIGKADEEQILQILYDRDSVFPKGLEYGLKQYLIDSGKIDELERIAASSGNKWRKIQALISIGYAASPKALGILGKSAFSRDEDIAYFSMLALAQIKNSNSAAILLDCLLRRKLDGHRIVSLLEAFPPEIVGEALKAAYYRDAAARYWVVKLLGKIKSNRQIARLIELTNDQSGDVRAASCEALGRLGAAQAKDAIVNCLKDTQWYVRLHAVSALSKIMGAQCLGEVIGLMKDEVWLVRSKVKDALRVDINAALPYIEKILLADTLEPGKKESIEALEEAGYFPALFKNILSQDEKARGKAVNLLNGIVRAGGHLGLEGALAVSGNDSRKKILEVVGQIDKALAEHIEKKLKQEMAEA